MLIRVILQYKLIYCDNIFSVNSYSLIKISQLAALQGRGVGVGIGVGEGGFSQYGLSLSGTCHCPI